MTPQTALESSVELLSIAMTQTSGGSSISWQLLLLAGIAAVAILVLAWIVWGGTGSD